MNEKKQSQDRVAGRDSLFLEMLTADKVEISDEAMAYFRQYPEEIDEVKASTRIHRFFLWLGVGIGLLAVAASKAITMLPLEQYIGLTAEEFLVEIIFEGGVALVGAALTAYFMGILLNNQQKRAKAFRKEIRRRLRDEAQ